MIPSTSRSREPDLTGLAQPQQAAVARGPSHARDFARSGAGGRLADDKREGGLARLFANPTRLYQESAMTDHRIGRTALASGVLLILASASVPPRKRRHSARSSSPRRRHRVVAGRALASVRSAATRSRKAGIMKIEDLKNYVPTLFMTETASATTFRYAAFSRRQPGFEQSVGTVRRRHLPRPPAADPPPFLDWNGRSAWRPQSILFGKNSVGGALNITTRGRPRNRRDGVSAL